MAVYEMFWDCPACGTEKLLGKTHRHCPNCGSAQDPDARYFPPESEKVAVADHKFVGRDLVCAHCETPNSAAAAHCTNCGAQIGDGDDEGVVLVHEREEDEAEPGPPPPRPSSPWGKLMGIGMLGFVLFSLFCCCLTIFWTRDGEAELTGRSWERNIAIERYASRADGAWCDSMPHDAYGVSRSQKQRSTVSIPDGEDCSLVNTDNGDGTYSQSTQCTTRYRQEPVYDDWCSYTVDRWGHDHWETAKGDQSSMPRWPPTSVSDCRSLGCTREGSRVETYTLFLEEVGGDADGDCDVSERVWMAASEGQRQAVKIGVIDGGIRCGSWD